VGGDPVNRNDPKGLCYYDTSTGQYWDDNDAQQMIYSGQLNPSLLEYFGDPAEATSCTDFEDGGGDGTYAPVFGASTNGATPAQSSAQQIVQQVGSNLQGSDVLFGLFTAPYILPAGTAAAGYLGTILPPLLASGAATATIGGVSVAALQQAASGGGPTTYVVTQISQGINWGQSLYVGVGQDAVALAQQYGTGGQFFQANIPTALLNLLSQAGLAWGVRYPRVSRFCSRRARASLSPASFRPCRDRTGYV
jgi:hypothetical protein